MGLWYGTPRLLLRSTDATYPEEDKSSLVVHPDKVEEAKRDFERLGCEVVTGKRYLGGFIGTRVELEAYVLDKIEEWMSVPHPKEGALFDVRVVDLDAASCHLKPLSRPS